MVPSSAPRTLLIGCGALAREVLVLIQRNGWHHMQLTCLPAKLHNRPEKIPDAVRRKIREGRRTHDRILVLYGDCGTGGRLDEVLAEEGVDRLPGPHCYAFFSGVERFLEQADDDPTCFYLTDYLVRHFETLVIKGLGLDWHPDLLPLYFGNYSKVVYLSQLPDARLERKSKAAALRLGLAYEHQPTGYGELAAFLRNAS